MQDSCYWPEFTANLVGPPGSTPDFWLLSSVFSLSIGLADSSNRENPLQIAVHGGRMMESHGVRELCALLS